MPRSTPTKWVTRGSGPWTFQQQVKDRRIAAAIALQAAYRRRLGKRSAIRVREFGKGYRPRWMK